MISFNEYLSEDISAEMKKAFSTKEKNNLKALFNEMNIKSDELTFKKADKSVITNYPNSDKECVIVVKANFEHKVDSSKYQNNIYNFLICGNPKNHYTGVFGDGTKFYADSTKWAKSHYPLSKIKETAIEVWVAELGKAESALDKAKSNPSISFKANAELLVGLAAHALKDVYSKVSTDRRKFASVASTLKWVSDYLREYEELGERMDKGNYTKEDVAEITRLYNIITNHIDKSFLS